MRQKSESLTGYLEFLIGLHRRDICTIITPRDPKERGAQLSIRFSRHGKEIFDRLTAAGVLCDWREPDVLRVAPIPLYNQYTEVFRFNEILSAILRDLGLKKK
ncbi:MAG: hypothetical protein ACRERV_15890 [Methylococcales bacterium]